jgi:hypothetical protein
MIVNKCILAILVCCVVPTLLKAQTKTPPGPKSKRSPFNFGFPRHPAVWVDAGRDNKAYCRPKPSTDADGVFGLHEDWLNLFQNPKGSVWIQNFTWLAIHKLEIDK